MRTLALAAWKGMPRSCPDDAHLLAALDAAGVPHEVLPWDAEADWAAYGGVLVRATWDYYARAGEFARWLDRLGAEGVRVWNPLEVLRWNMDKRYLLELAAKGLDVVPTRLLATGEALAPLLDAEGWEQAVVKPVVSAGAHLTRRARRGDAMRFEAPMLVQPFVREVAERGEWSLVFLDGAFSHALRKRPAPGDFRVQEKHGGSTARAEPSPAQVAKAREVLQRAPGPLLYARVDMVEVQGRMLLMELEALEPELFFRLDPGAAPRIARALALALA